MRDELRSHIGMQNIFEVIVVGGGHAGVEAAMASARLGCRTGLFSLSLDTLANMPCNPSIGGTAKGHLVREIDALGGVMGILADSATIQSRILNLGKGPAVHSIRAQVDRVLYHNNVKQLLESQENLFLVQAQVTEILFDDNAREVYGIKTACGELFAARAVIVASGTFLKAQIHVGEHVFESGPDALAVPKELVNSLEAMGLPLRRFKTGTPCRVHERSINFSELEIQFGDREPQPFSFSTDIKSFRQVDQMPCYIAYTNANTHEIISNNLSKSPLYGDKKTIFNAPGPRYCPSIEDKIVRFPDKSRHQIFVEPMGRNTKEFYLQGLSSSLPVEVQKELLKSIKGFENVEITRNAYAISYICLDPLALTTSLAVKGVIGLWGAGQFNGTSGYEEAAAQGLIAGINAALFVKSRGTFSLSRISSYIGTLIDDLTTKGCTDPYRIMTSHSEYRLLLRQDNADQRLMKYGYELGLVSSQRWDRLVYKKHQIDSELKRIEQANIFPSDRLNQMLQEKGTAIILSSSKFIELLRRPQLHYADIKPYDNGIQEISLDQEITEQVELFVKYQGYIARQQAQAEQLLKLDAKKLPQNINYSNIRGLSLEATEKLNTVQPTNLAQASKISGISPADIAVLLIWMQNSAK